ncbi:hypothetical protein [Anaerohalosphaera lusitana]|nr:hypothetical protein [Anaerohalosphaera lusitana]
METLRVAVLMLGPPEADDISGGGDDGCSAKDGPADSSGLR